MACICGQDRRRADHARPRLRQGCGRVPAGVAAGVVVLADYLVPHPPRRSPGGFLRYSVALRLYVYLLKPGWQCWKNQALREWVTPADWQALRLPDRLFWAYVLVRPFGWLIRYCGRDRDCPAPRPTLFSRFSEAASRQRPAPEDHAPQAGPPP
jgi:hypothetical protein